MLSVEYADSIQLRSRSLTLSRNDEGTSTTMTSASSSSVIRAQKRGLLRSIAVLLSRNRQLPLQVPEHSATDALAFLAGGLFPADLELFLARHPRLQRLARERRPDRAPITHDAHAGELDGKRGRGCVKKAADALPVGLLADGLLVSQGTAVDCAQHQGVTPVLEGETDVLDEHVAQQGGLRPVGVHQADGAGAAAVGV